ncbi:MAG: hypothetical protein R3233_07400 [Xanthomonadales bacterium]|nr:hypothetical protein [Xanthomonadales bacterium]
MSESAESLALVIRSAPETDVSGRGALDVALAAASIGWPLDLYFVGDGLRHLVPLPDGNRTRADHARSWRALVELTDVAGWYDEFGRQHLPAAVSAETVRVLKLEPLAVEAMSEQWREAGRVVVL